MEGEWDKIKIKRSWAWKRFTWFEEYDSINDSWLKASEWRKSSQNEKIDWW